MTSHGFRRCWNGEAQIRDRRIMRSTALCSGRASCTDDSNHRLTALAALGLCGAPVHEPVHAWQQAILMTITQSDTINVRRP